MTKLFSENQTVDDAGKTFTIIDNVAVGDNLAFNADVIEVTNHDGANPVFFSPRGTLPNADGTLGIRVAPTETVKIVFDQDDTNPASAHLVGWATVKARTTVGLTASFRVTAFAR